LGQLEIIARAARTVERREKQVFSAKNETQNTNRKHPKQKPPGGGGACLKTEGRELPVMLYRPTSEKTQSGTAKRQKKEKKQKTACK
jgi:hypothetical protein